MTQPANRLAASSGQTACGANVKRRRPAALRAMAVTIALAGLALLPPQAKATESAALQASLSSRVVADFLNNPAEAKIIPGSTVEFTLNVANPSTNIALPTDLVIAQAVPQELSLYVGDIAAAGRGPVEFVQGAAPSGLVYAFLSLADVTDSIEFSADGGLTFDYHPAPDANGIDPRITHFRVRLLGAMALRIDAIPSFSIRYRTRVK
jgi:hypothetical protein